MTTPLLALLFFVAWTLGLVALGVGPYRVLSVLLRGAKPNAFPADTPHGPDLYRRVIRAHMNCVENLPAFASVVLVGAVADVQDPRLGPLAVFYVIMRVGQTTAHVASGRNRWVNVRFAFFLAQMITLVAMLSITAAALLARG